MESSVFRRSSSHLSFPTLLFTSLFAVCLLAIPGAHAIPITFDLKGSADSPDEVSSGSMTVDGLTVTISANDGALNQTGGGYGINASGVGDETAQIDHGSGLAEKMTLSFDADVFLKQVVLALLTGGQNDAASLSIAGAPIPSLTDTGSKFDAFNFTTDNFLSSGQFVEIGWKSGNGFSFENFTVETRTSESIPDSSSTVSMLLISVLGILGIRKMIASPSDKLRRD